MPVTVRVPAKVNLHLQVLPARADGFHELCTVFHAVSLYDTVTATAGSGLSLRVVGEQVAADASNLAWRAAELLAAATGVPADADLVLAKSIPVAGGMAGGSADAAAALVACSALWQVRADLAVLAAQLGSDVAFPLLGGTALGTGRGEVLAPIVSVPLHWAFAFADFGISAGAAYRELDRQRSLGIAPATVGAPDALTAALAGGTVDEIGGLLGNDLQPAAIALAPSLGDTLARGLEAGAVAGIVSGSGPTCAFLCRSAEQARDIAEALASRSRVATAAGPVPGAAVIS